MGGVHDPPGDILIVGPADARESSVVVAEAWPSRVCTSFTDAPPAISK